ncbi:hypothetical protein D3C72_1935410 [compost metagenome]
MQHERRCRIHPQAPNRPQAARRDLLFRLVNHRQDGAGVFQECRPFLGQLQPPRGSPQQRGLQFLLQPAQGAAGGGDRQLELLGGRRDRAGVHHGGKGQQFVDGRLHY